MGGLALLNSFGVSLHELYEHYFTTIVIIGALVGICTAMWIYFRKGPRTHLSLIPHGPVIALCVGAIGGGVSAVGLTILLMAIIDSYLLIALAFFWLVVLSVRGLRLLT
jgi:hypothetical protein